MLLRENAGSVLCCLQANGGPVLLPSTPRCPPSAKRKQKQRNTTTTVCVCLCKPGCLPPTTRPACLVQTASAAAGKDARHAVTNSPARAYPPRPQPAAPCCVCCVCCVCGVCGVCFFCVAGTPADPTPQTQTQTQTHAGAADATMACGGHLCCRSNVGDPACGDEWRGAGEGCGACWERRGHGRDRRGATGPPGRVVVIYLC